ncbi:hypothetical protein ACK8HX_02480 [Oryzobacter sp. R7]|uniref:hypothetical protein n=1 Tax=Oryzobacter faecalis TaxID=3388656 RepID=UPI00398C89B8
MQRIIVAALAALIVGLVQLESGWAMPMHHKPGHTVSGSVVDEGTVINTLGLESVKALTNSYYKSALAEPPFYDYAGVSVCGDPEPGDENADNVCPLSWGICRVASGGGDGPAVRIFRREVSSSGSPLTGAPGSWTPVHLTCFPEAVPGAGRVLSMAMIRHAFRETDFTRPTVNIQPEGDVTLVNLPTYFEVRFPEAGFGPDEVDTPDPSLLLGHTVEIRPRLKSVTYHLGEQTVGPTTSLGGPHPTGDITATYTRPGTRQVRVDVVYTGQFRVGGSGWIDIPGEVDLTGAPVTLTVREARSRLYTPG